MKPKVSVIMPVLNGERFIGEAIASIAQQTYKNVELVVVDDGSSDGTRPIVESFSGKLAIRYVHHPSPQGIPKSMNDGIRNSTGDFISFLDHDDAWMPDFVETQLTYLENHPAVAMVHSDFQTIDVSGNVLEESVAVSRNRSRPSGQVFKQLFMDSFIVGNSVLIRRDCLDRAGLFDETLRWGDYHLWLRIAHDNLIDYIPKVLTKYRQHPTQSTRSSKEGHPYADCVPLQAATKILELFPDAAAQLGSRAVNARLATFYFELAYTWWSRQMFGHARICLRKAILLSPFVPRYYLLFGASLLRPSWAMSLRGARRSIRGAVLTSEARTSNLASGRAE